MEMEKLNENQVQRPALLTFLCILTFIGSGLTFLSNTTVYVLYDQFTAYFSQHPNLNWMGTKMDFSFFLNIHPAYFLLQGLLSAMAFTGAVYMWNLRKIGFHFYTFAQLVLLIIPKIFIPDLPFPLFQLGISALFVYLYYNHLKLMR
jgi:hypothetical protein